MQYRSTTNIILPFKVHAVVTEVSSKLVEYKIVLKSNFKKDLLATNVVLKIPTPVNAINAKITVNHGKAKYNGSENCVIWKIQKIQGGAELLFSGDVELAPSDKKWTRPPISVDFHVVMFTSSGLFVRFLKIFEKGMTSHVKWVRYQTKAGSYQIRF